MPPGPQRWNMDPSACDDGALSGWAAAIREAEE
jgi:hypothetical protein